MLRLQGYCFLRAASERSPVPCAGKVKRRQKLCWKTSRREFGMASVSPSAVSAGLAVCQAALQSVSPQQLVGRALAVRESERGCVMCVQGREYLLNHNVKVVAFGKAVLGMVAALEALLKEHIVEGVASVPVGSLAALQPSTTRASSHIRLLEGAAHNLPDAQAHTAAREILAVANRAAREDIVVALISGGGSALLPLPVEGVSLEDKTSVIKALAGAGATIHELNSFRKYLSRSKGGKLAEAVYPAQMVSLILSDVIYDPLDIIASGPTVPSTITSRDISALLTKYQLSVPLSIERYLKSTSGVHEQSTPIENRGYCHVQNVIVGSNSIATAAAGTKAAELGYQSVVWSHAIQGEARLLGEVYAMLAGVLSGKHDAVERKTALLHITTEPSFLQLMKENEGLCNEFERIFKMLGEMDKSQNLCIIGGGEPTVTLKGKGRGGRNQELSLAFTLKSAEISTPFDTSTGTTSQRVKESDCTFFSFGTDGQDGPTDAAGAIGHASLAAEAVAKGVDGKECLARNDSYSFFASLSGGQYHIKTGLTGTNVMDLHLLLVEHSNA